MFGFVHDGYCTILPVPSIASVHIDFPQDVVQSLIAVEASREAFSLQAFTSNVYFQLELSFQFSGDVFKWGIVKGQPAIRPVTDSSRVLLAFTTFPVRRS